MRGLWERIPPLARGLGIVALIALVVVVLSLEPVVATVGGILQIAFFLAIAFTRIVSVASLASVAGALGGYVLLTSLGYVHFHPATLVFVLVAGGIIVWRHRPNIERIMRGAEPRVLS